MQGRRGFFSGLLPLAMMHEAVMRHSAITAGAGGSQHCFCAGHCVWEARAPGRDAAEAGQESALCGRGARWAEAGRPARPELLLGQPGGLSILAESYCGTLSALGETDLHVLWGGAVSSSAWRHGSGQPCVEELCSSVLRSACALTVLTPFERRLRQSTCGSFLCIGFGSGSTQ